MSLKPLGILESDGRLLFRRTYRPVGLWSRARGLLGRPPLAEDEAWLFEYCSAVHMLGMRHAIDVIFVDAWGRIQHLVESLRPWRAAACLHAAHVVEAPAGSIRRLGLQPGQCLAFKSLNQTRVSGP